MSNQFSELENAWQQSKKNLQHSSIGLDEFYKKIRANKKENFAFYYGTIIILSITFIGIASFFYSIAPVEKLLSRTGVSFMLIGLFIRIIIEIISISKSKKVHVLDSSLDTVNNTIAFHKFRKKIHEIISPIIIVFYTVGFYMITPEFRLYLPFWSVVFWDVSYLVMAVVLFIQIRKGVKKEMKILQGMINLHKRLVEENL